MPRRSKKHCHAFSKDAAPDLLLVGPGNPSYRDQAHATAHPTCPCHCLVTLATRSPGRGAPCSPQEKNATVMLGFLASSNTDPLMRWVVVSCPANNSRNTITTISSRLIPPLSFSTRTSSAIKPSPPTLR